MTPGARVQAAIEVLDRVFAGSAAERELTAWARGSRYAGSKDRAAVRDHVFDAMRRLRSAAWTGGLGDVGIAQMSGRAVMAGLLRDQGLDTDALFSGVGHAPEPLEPIAVAAQPSDAVALDCPDWLLPLLRESLGDDADAVIGALRDRAPVVVRTNLALTTRTDLATSLADDGFETEAHPLSPSALTITGKTRGLTALSSFNDGLFEMQDAGSQALVDRLPVLDGQRVLDLCAGGGGKALALAARAKVTVLAHDADPARMRDLPVRADRAGVRIDTVDAPERAGPFDGVVADVPCSGSGSWRRAPEAKWRLTQERLAALNLIQGEILGRAVALTRPGGWIGYMTCSLLRSENEDVCNRVLDASPGLQVETRWRCSPLSGADGFHLTILRKG